MVKQKDQPAAPSADAAPARALDRFAGDPDFMLSLARGLLVLHAFEREPQLSVSRAAALTGLPRPTARRCLYTLEQLGYISGQSGSWQLRPVMLSLARAYLTSTRFAEAAQAHLDRLRDEVGESCSLGVLDQGDVVYIGRSETQRIIAVALHVGSRLPGYCTSMGRVLLAALKPEAREAYLSAAPFPARTPHTLITADAIRAELARVAVDGFAVIDQELEIGLRSIAVPVRDRDGQVVAALNVGLATSRADRDTLVARFLPALKTAAARIGELSDLPS